MPIALMLAVVLSATSGASGQREWQRYQVISSCRWRPRTQDWMVCLFGGAKCLRSDDGRAGACSRWPHAGLSQRMSGETRNRRSQMAVPLPPMGVPAGRTAALRSQAMLRGRNYSWSMTCTPAG